MTATVDIFISYKREERGLAQDVARALQEAGYTTVTDLNIQKSKDFGDAIDQMIREARLVVVLWTPASVNSEWVRLEATEANALGKYLGVVLKPLAREDLPLELRRRQYLDLGDPAGRDLSRIAADVADLIGQGSAGVEDANIASEALNDDFHLFQIVDRLGYAEGYQAYLNDFPDGIFAARARARIESARAARSAVKVAPDMDTSVQTGALASARETIERQRHAIAGLEAQLDELSRTRWWTRLSVVWLIPLAALAVSGFLVLREFMSRSFDQSGFNETAVQAGTESAKTEFGEPADATASLGISTGSGRPETESGKPSAPAANRITYEDLPEHLKCRTEVARSLDLSQPGQSSGGFQVASDVEMSAGVVLDRFGCIPLSVTSLNLDTLHLEDAAVLAFLPALEQLTLSNTAIKDWSFLEVMTSLRKLDLKATGILNLQPLSGLTGLRTLDLFGTPAASWDGLAPLANLHWFRAPDGQAAGNPLIDSASTRAQVAELIASGTFKP